LRLTVPADLYQSGIVVELEGIEVKLETNYAKKESTADLEQRSREPGSKRYRTITADRSRSTQSLVHDPGGPPASVSSNIHNQEEDEPLEELSFTVDLAQSFLQEEPQAEKEELKAAIVKSRQPDQSPTPSDTEDDETAFGVGNALSLPSFLADFLKGVGDRIQLKVKKAMVDLDLKLELSAENPGIAIGGGPDVVTIRLSIDDVDLQGVMPTQTPVDRTRNTRDLGSKRPDKQPLQAIHETRHVVMNNIEVMLVSDASLFVNLSRFDVPPSPTATQTSSVSRTGTKIRAAASSSSLSDSSPIPDVVQHSGLNERDPSMLCSPGSEASSIISDGRRFADPDGDEEVLEKSASAHISSMRYSQYEDSVDERLSDTDDAGRDSDDEIFGVGNADFNDSEYHQSLTQKHSRESYLGCAKESGLSRRTNLEDSGNQFSTQGLPPLSLKTSSGHPSSHHQGSLLNVFTDRHRLSLSHREDKAQPRLQNSGSISPTSPTSDDLTQSKIFSHEEAESMYMSAISHDPPGEGEAELALPGQWDESGSQLTESTPRPDLSHEPLMLSSRDPPLLETSTINESYALRNSSTSTEHSGPSSTLKPGLAHTVYSDPHVSGTGEESKSPANQLLSHLENTSSEIRRNPSSRLQTPLAMMKKIISIDSVHMELPAEVSISARSGPPGAEQSVGLNAPGKAFDGSDSLATGRHEAEGLLSETVHLNRSRGSPSRPTSVEVGQMEILGDIGLTKLTILVIQQNLALLENEGTDNEDRDGSKLSPFSLRLKVADISWKFLDSVRGFSGPGGSTECSFPGPSSFTATPEVLLKASVRNLDFAIDRFQSSKNSKLSVGKLSFGYASEDILSFDSESKMRESTGDTLAPVGNDVVLTSIQTSGAIKINLTTLPIRFVLDLRRLDETFSWFGGFSSILGLGSSMMSTVTVVSAKPTPPNPKRPRAVHFEQTATDKVVYENPVITQKFTARLGGLAVVLQGASCTFRLDGTAFKIVSRLEGIGLQVDKLRFTGPYMGQIIDECAVSIHLANIRLEYVSIPEEVDLTRLLSLLSPSKDKYEQDDDILLDTLLHQRRQGGVIRITIESVQGNISELLHLRSFLDITEELKKLSTVAKYLPEDDRPGILTFGLVREIKFVVSVNDSFGSLTLSSQSVELAYVTLPSLTALGIQTLQVHRNNDEELIGDAYQVHRNEGTSSPTIMARFIGNEMEPVIKVKIQSLRLEYHVSALMAAMSLSDVGSPEVVMADMISSIATLKGREQASDSPPPSFSQSSSKSDKSITSTRLPRLDIAIRDSIVGLNPLNHPSRGLVVLTNAHLNGMIAKVDEAQATFEINRASLLIIDDKDNINLNNEIRRPGVQDNGGNQIQHLLNSGFVSVSYISSAKASMSLVKSRSSVSQVLDVEIRDDLLVLESCADSTQTLQTILNGLKLPVPQSSELKYRTEIVPVEDMLASFSGDAFATSPSTDDDTPNHPLGLDEGDMMDDEVPENLEYVSSFYNPNPAGLHEGIADSMLDNDLESLAGPPATREIGDKRLLESFQEQYQVAPGNAPLDFQENHFGTTSAVGGTAHRWDTKQNTYGLTSDFRIRESPLRLRVRNVHIIWNLFDGYDWQHTRDIITKAVIDIESKAAERYSMKDKRKSNDVDEEEGSEIGDFLFNSIYIGVPANRDPKELARQVNRNIDDLASETESYAASSVSASPSQQNQIPRAKGKKLRLTRSKYHKMTFELKGVSADLVMFPPDAGETQSSIDIRVQDLDIFDHVPTSTWKKFLTYMHDAGERESGTSMIHLEILNVKPVPTLAASEIILKVCVSFKAFFSQVNRQLGYSSSAATSCRSGCSRFHDPFLRVQR
jgi:autophagy-related protein 2